MKGKVFGIRLKDRESQKRIALEECTFIKDKGIQGDAYALGGERQVAFLDEAAKDSIENTAIGFCVKKFKENISIGGLDFSSLQKGSVLNVGDARVLISDIGKKCFDGCPRREAVETCPMKRGCFFAKVQLSGRVALGDEVYGA